MDAPDDRSPEALRQARAALLRYVDKTYGPGEYRYHLERLADPDDLPDLFEIPPEHTDDR